MTRFLIGCLLSGFFGLSSGGCAKQTLYRDDAARQSAMAAKAKERQLAPVLGEYSGQMHLMESNLTFEVRFVLAVGDENLPSTQSADPTMRVRSPKLVGAMQFPAILNAKGSPFDSLPWCFFRWFC